jgi:transposase
MTWDQQRHAEFKELSTLKADARRERRRRVRALAVEGLTLSEIAVRLGVSKTLVYFDLKALGARARSAREGALAQLPHGLP